MTLPAAIIVVTHNHAGYIERCLRSLLALDPGPAELIVVDNQSSDGTPELVRRLFPSIRLLRPEQNLGFAGGCNIAVRHSTAPFVVLANPDLTVGPDWLRELLSVFEERPSAGVVGGKLLFPDGRRVQHAGGFLAMPLALGQHRGYGEEDDTSRSAIEQVEYVTGAALACSRELWQRLGGMDEGFWPAYYEEVDFCLRVKALGREILYTPRAVGLHVEAAGLGRESERFYRFFHRNRLRLLFRHFSADWLIRRWLPAELAYLRSVASDVELSALAAVYLAYQAAALSGRDEARIEVEPLPEDSTGGGGETELQWVERQLSAKASIRHVPPSSRLPVVGLVRRLLSRLLVADELRPVVQQQNDANAAVREAVQALVRQRRAADAAILLQGMLLARTTAPARSESPTAGAGL